MCLNMEVFSLPARKVSVFLEHPYLVRFLMPIAISSPQAPRTVTTMSSLLANFSLISFPISESMRRRRRRRKQQEQREQGRREGGRGCEKEEKTGDKGNEEGVREGGL